MTTRPLVFATPEYGYLQAALCGSAALEPGDIEEGLRAAAAIGDDTLQRRGQGHVTPESWTHGSAAQRTHWFKVGLSTGKVASCDTFKDAGR